MATPVNIKTVLFYVKRRLQPETMDRIKNAKDGDMIPVLQEEFDAIQEFHFYEPQFKKAIAQSEKDSPRTTPKDSEKPPQPETD